MAELAVGATFADHEIRGIAGRGGMGVVYRALDRRLKREVALKVIAPESSKDPEFRTRFQRECEVAASIHHPNLIPVYNAGEEDGCLFVTMRFVDGVDLARLIATNGPLDAQHAAGLIAQVAMALDAAHDFGVVHRDVKPANVLLDGGHALLTDFGLQKDLRQKTRVTEPGTLIGTFDYTAPEQLEDGDVDARTDVYALGCVLYEAVTGEVPYPRDTAAAKMYAHLGAPPPSVIARRPDAPELLEEVVRKAMSKRPDARFPSAGAMGRAALDAVGAARTTVSAPRPTATTPLPPALIVECGRQTFIGRAAARDAIEQRYARAAAGERQLVLIEGEPGIGKTRLASEAAREAHSNGATVLYGRADQESLLPYQPFVTALQHYAAHAPQPPTHLPLGELARFVPNLRREHEILAADPEARRFALFESVTRLLGHIAKDRPAVLILDDIQWADVSTSLLLAHLLADLEPMRLLVLATKRQAESGPDELKDLIARQFRQPSFERVALPGLDRHELAAFVSVLEERAATPGFLRRLKESTEGNPFFVEETIRSLEPGADLERALGHAAVPEGVKEMVSRRLARLADDARHALTIAAVIGREFRLDVLETMSGGEALDAVEAACDAGLVREAEEVDLFLFAHALVRETLYEQMSNARRVRMHRRIGEALETGEDPNPAELARHFFESRHLDQGAKAFAYSLRAAQRAADALAHQEAAEHYRRALEIHPRIDVLLALGTVELRAGDAAARATFERAANLARTEGDTDAFAEAALGFNARQAASGVLDSPGIALLEEAETAQPAGPLLAKVKARLADALHFAAQEERTLQLSKDALEIAKRSGDPEALAATLVARHGALLHVEHLDERLRLAKEIIAAAEHGGSRELLGLGRWWHIYDLLEVGEVDAARREHQALTTLAAELRQPLYLHFAAAWEVVWAQMADSPADIERLAARAYELGLRGSAPDAEMIHLVQIMTIRLQQGRLPEFLETVRPIAEAFPNLPGWRAGIAVALLISGQREEGLAIYQELVADDAAAIPRNMSWLTSICLLSWCCALVSDAERAPDLYRLLEPYRERTVQDVLAANWGSVERYLGSLAAISGDYRKASEHFEIALERNAAWGMQQPLRLTRTEYAQVLLATGQADKAAALLQATLEDAEAAGLSALADFVRVQLDGLARVG